jgi:hypothetical protein
LAVFGTWIPDADTSEPHSRRSKILGVCAASRTEARISVGESRFTVDPDVSPVFRPKWNTNSDEERGMLGRLTVQLPTLQRLTGTANPPRISQILVKLDDPALTNQEVARFNHLLRGNLQAISTEALRAVDQDGDVIDILVQLRRDHAPPNDSFEDYCADKEKNHFGLLPTNYEATRPPCEAFWAKSLTPQNDTPTTARKSRISLPAKENGKCADSNLLVKRSGSSPSRRRPESLPTRTLAESDQSSTSAFAMLRHLADCDSGLKSLHDNPPRRTKMTIPAQVDNAQRHNACHIDIEYFLGSAPLRVFKERILTEARVVTRPLSGQQLLVKSKTLPTTANYRSECNLPNTPSPFLIILHGMLRRRSDIVLG